MGQMLGDLYEQNKLDLCLTVHHQCR